MGAERAAARAVVMKMGVMVVVTKVNVERVAARLEGEKVGASMVAAEKVGLLLCRLRRVFQSECLLRPADYLPSQTSHGAD